MSIRYGGIILYRRHFTVYGESINFFITPTKLWLITHKIICWASKRQDKILKAAHVCTCCTNDYRVYLSRRLSSLNKKLDCVIDGLLFDINFNDSTIHIRALIS